ncbi:MAG: hypothetical protein R3D98_04705 [Candidatus Krumholzibacteriia bacterium]
MPFQADQSAQDVHLHLARAVRDFRRAEHNVVVWFGEMKRRKLFRELGYSS